MADDTSVSLGGLPPSNSPGEPRRGDVIGGRWRLEEFLRSGGMGRVWRATDLRLAEAVAIKLMAPALVETEAARERFLREARAGAQLRGPNVVSILDFDIDADRGIPYMAMELLRGEDLARRLEHGPLPYAETVAIVADVCAAMARAHRLRIVHRDLKPGNVFLLDRRGSDLGSGPVAKVLDFGIVKLGVELLTHEGHPLTQAGAALGTAYYMSPEQIENAVEVDHRADLWSIGVITFECLTGHRPFRAKSVVELIRMICDGSPLVPSKIAEVPAGFDAWFARATARDPQRRFVNAAELIDALRKLEARASSAAAVGSDLPPPSRSWASDANQIDIRELRELTFKNAVVHDFLDSQTKHFVSGSKGLGKTLLLTYKRSLLSEHYQAGEARAQSVKFIPEGRPYLDLMGDLPTLNQGAVDLMSSLDQCKRLWSFGFRMCAVSNHPGLIDERDGEDLARFPSRLRAILEDRPSEPTVIVKELLTLSFGKVNQLIDQTEGFLEYKVRSLHSGVFIFVDKLDQALRQLPRAAWIHMQAGMIEAAWDLMNTNRHIKIFATIREEAFSSYESDIKTNLYGATSTLRYSKADLHELLEKLTHFYERLPLREFVNLDVVSVGRAARSEPAFDFIHRHTLGRPRDLVIIASEISRNRANLDEQTFKRVVEDTAASLLVSNVFDEMRVFLEVLCEREQRGRFLASLPYNILVHDELVELWCRFHGVDREYYELHGREAEEVYHPFRELYDCGLLGVVARDPSTGRRSQRFRQPYDAIAGSQRQLPRSRHYLLHPALQVLVARLAGGGSFRVFQHVIIGHELPWLREYGLLVDVQRELFRRGEQLDEDSEESVLELLASLDAHMSAGESFAEARRIVAGSRAFAQLCARLERFGWDDLHLALLELFPPDTLDEAGPLRGGGRRRGRSPAKERAREQPRDLGPASRRTTVERELGGRVPTDELEQATTPPRSHEPGEAESGTDRVELAMLLVDIVKSTRMVLDVGDTQFVEHLRALRAALEAGGERLRVLKGTGDGYLAGYGSVAEALAAAHSLRGAVDEPGRLRLVIHRGPVRLGAGDVFGSEVHRLFRIESVGEDARMGPPSNALTLPQAGRVLLSRPALLELPEGERGGFERVGEFRLEGFDEPEEIWVEARGNR